MTQVREYEVSSGNSVDLSSACLILIGLPLSVEVRMLPSSWQRDGTFHMRALWPVSGEKVVRVVKVTNIFASVFSNSFVLNIQ